MTIFCERCGKPNDANWNFCQNCGAPLKRVLPQPTIPNGFCAAIDSCLRQYATFRGRASRTEYWLAFCAYLFFYLIASAYSWDLLCNLERYVDASDYYREPQNFRLAFSFAYFLLWNLPLCFVAIPMWAVSARRLHDSGLSAAHLIWPYLTYVAAGGVAFASLSAGWNIAILWIAFAIVQAIFAALCSRRPTPGPNRFGPAPKPVGR